MGDDSFTYTLSDGNGGTVTGTILVKDIANYVNAAPVAASDTIVVNVDAPEPGSLLSLLD